MKTRKVILNDNSNPMTKSQARREIREFILDSVLKSYKAYCEKPTEPGQDYVEINWDEIMDASGEVTLRDLLELNRR